MQPTLDLSTEQAKINPLEVINFLFSGKTKPSATITPVTKPVCVAKPGAPTFPVVKKAQVQKPEVATLVVLVKQPDVAKPTATTTLDSLSAPIPFFDGNQGIG